MNDLPDYLPRSLVMRLLGVCSATMTRYIRKHKLIVYRFSYSKETMLSRSAVEDLLAYQRTHPHYHLSRRQSMEEKM